jgi:radical SAM-linked protein
LRLIFTKDEPLRYISNLDVMRLWERAFRRAGVPVAYSHGFNPRPRMVIASALPLGVTGDQELMDLWLEEPMDPQELVRKVSAQLPTGARLLSAEVIGDKAPSLPSLLRGAEYEVLLEGIGCEAVEERVRQLLAAMTIPRERRGKRYDLRPLVKDLWVEEAGGVLRLRMRLRAEPGATGRPDEVIDALGLTAHARRPQRVQLILASPNRV